MKIGILSEGTPEQSISLMKEAGINLVRASINFKDSFQSDRIDGFLKDGYDVAINFNYKQAPTSIPFPTDINFIQQQADDFFHYYLPYKDQIPFVAIENEWCNTTYHSGTIEDYINELKVITAVAHQYGFKVADSGTTTVALCSWYASILSPSDRKTFKAAYFTNNQFIKPVASFLQQIAAVPIDYLNVHWYNEKTCAGRLPEMVAAFAKTCNKSAVVCNEFGVRDNPDLLECTATEIKSSGFDYAIAYSGTNKAGKAIQLTNNDLKLFNINTMSNIISVKAGSTGGTYKPGDILNFEPGEYTYFILRGGGTKENPVVLNFTGKTTFKAGFDVVDCGGLVFNGNNNLYLDVPQVPFSFAGKCHDVIIKDCTVLNCYSSLQWKTEVNELRFANWNYWNKNADGTISASYVMIGLQVINMIVENCKFDNMYVGSTDHPPSRGGVTIDGEHFNPKPPSVSDIHLENIVIKNSARTGIQISGLIGKGSYIRNSSISNSGTGKEKDQGAHFRIGLDSPDGFEISDCDFDTSNMAAVHIQGGGDIVIKGNKFKNSCIGSEPMAALWLAPTKAVMTKYTIQNNQIDKSNNGVSIVLYGDKSCVSPESIIDNTNKLEGSFQNFSGVAFKTGDTPPPPTDTEAPTVTINPVDAITLPENSVNLKAVVTDNTGISSLVWEIKTGTGNILSPGTAETQITGLNEGQTTLRVTATDAAGNEGFAETTVTVLPKPIEVSKPLSIMFQIKMSDGRIFKTSDISIEEVII